MSPEERYSQRIQQEQMQARKQREMNQQILDWQLKRKHELEENERHEQTKGWGDFS